VVVGGPPCTPFSYCGYWLAYKRAGEDPKASLFDEYVRMVAGVQPKAFLMENAMDSPIAIRTSRRRGRSRSPTASSARRSRAPMTFSFLSLG
jgi:hypothetical protein